jgi:oxygen-independent coproporphyrinogen-3 oxidase
MALGAGATTKFVFKPDQDDTCCQTAKGNDLDMRMERVENVKDVTNYLERVDEMIERKIRKMEEIKWH